MSEKADRILRGPDLLCAAVNQILARPETWNQASWHCGTTHCIAGHCELLSGGTTQRTFSNARKLLGISVPDAHYLFSSSRSLYEIYSFAKTFRAGYDRAGYDRAGYNRAGYDRAGYDRAGYDLAGYDRAGYDRAGYNRAGEKIELVPFEL